MVSWQQDAAAILNALPHRIHEVMDRYVAATPDRTALIDDKATLTYREAPRGDNSVGTLFRASRPESSTATAKCSRTARLASCTSAGRT